MIKQQRGVSLGGLAAAAFVVILLAMLALKIVPTVTEFYTIDKIVKGVVAESKPADTVHILREAYERGAQINEVRDVLPADLDISKTGGRLVISFAYDKKIPLFGPVSLLISYKGSSDH